MEAEPMRIHLPRWEVKRGVLLFAAAALIVLAGCEKPKVDSGDNLSPPGMLSAWRLADQLNLTVVQLSRCSATLEGRGNSVVVYANPGGKVYVNGRPVADGDVVCMGNEVFVQPQMVPAIRAALRDAPSGIAVSPPAIGPQPPAGTGDFKGTIVIDPGHGGKDPGATAVTGQQEKQIVLAVARSLAVKLQQRGARVVLTRSNDRFLELEERADVANRAKADLFVSIHADSAANRSAQGFTVYVSRSASASSRYAADAIIRGLCATGLDNRGIRSADYRVLVRTNCPAVLVELGYLSNWADAAKLQNDAFQDRLADAICQGIGKVLARK